MATLYEINNDILSCIDMETGEIVDEERFHSLQLDRKQKLRNIALLALNLQSDIIAYKEQEEKFKARRKSAEKTLAWCKETLERSLDNQPMKEAEFTVSFNPASVEIDDEKSIPKEYMVTPPPKILPPAPDKRAIKQAIENGKQVAGARLVRHVKIK